jgi:choline/ethanolamine kinase
VALNRNVLALRTGGVCLIDYEYACAAPAAYDIANHYCEWAADYAEAPADGSGMLAYRERYPNAAQRTAFAAAYLAARRVQDVGQRGKPDAPASDGGAAPHAREAPAGCADGGSRSLEHDALALARAADRYAAASHALWGLWGLVQARHSSVAGFDFSGYARARFEEMEQHAERLAAEEV